MNPEKLQQHVYLNPVQMRSYLAYSNHEILIAGRGMGKSEGIIAPRVKRWAEEMPRCTIIAEAATYQQHWTRTLPGVFAGLERLGWIQGRDFFVGRYAPEKLGIPKPIFRPVRTEYMIHLRTGASIVLVSHDRPGSANGLSAAAVFGDEAKFLKHDKHNTEVMPAIRGNGHIFGDAASYGAMLLTSDMPISSSAQWLLDYGDSAHQEERITAIIEIQLYVNDCKSKLRSSDLTPTKIKYYKDEISLNEKLLLRMRKGDPENKMDPSFYFHEASSLENYQILGASYFQRMRKDLSPLDYRTSILNQRVKQIKDGFYPFLSEDIHGYTMYNNGYLDMLGHDLGKFNKLDSRQDLDVDSNKPLDIALDYGGNFNCLLVGQRHVLEYRYLHGMHVEVPKKLKDLIYQFKEYYSHHKDKHVRFYYDHTAKQNNASNEYLYWTEVVDILRDSTHGSWTVEAIDIGRTPSPSIRYEMWIKILQSNDIKFKYHTIHCEHWSTSCMLAPLKQGSNGLEKDKSSERDKKLSGKRERATHYSDAGDTLAYAAIYPLIRGDVYESTGLPFTFM